MSRKRGKKTDSKVTLDNRYGIGWEKISIQAREIAPICCHCLVKLAKVTHHVRYVGDDGNLLLDDVVIGSDVFPLCEKCHRVVHSNKHWLYGETKAHNRNTDVCIDRLKFGFLIVKCKV